MEELFPLQNFPVLKNLLGTHDQTQEEGYNQGHKNVDGNVLIIPEYVCTAGGIHNVADNVGQDKGQQGTYQQGHQDLLTVVDLGAHIPFQVVDELPEPTRDLQAAWGW